MNKKIWILFLALVSCYSSFAFESDSLLLRESAWPKYKPSAHDSWYQYGFRLGFNFPLNRDYSKEDQLTKLFSGEFGVYFRAGKYVYGEIGMGYMFHKGTYYTEMDTNSSVVYSGKNIVETRYLQIPIKAVGYIPFKKNFAFQPSIGIIYQPLIQVAKNNIGYTRDNITRHQFLFTGGVGFKLYFVTIDISYRQMLRNFFSDKPSNKPKYLNLQIGFQF
ncbi:MAG: hypothetical protein RR356_02480 [Bacteroidales bacterium]